MEIHKACRENNIERVKELVNKYKNSGMFIIIAFGHLMVQTDNKNNTPLHIACKYSTLELIKLLPIEDEYLFKNVDDITPLDVANRYNKEIFDYLMNIHFSRMNKKYYDKALEAI